jgi:hypothetical protein
MTGISTGAVMNSAVSSMSPMSWSARSVVTALPLVVLVGGRTYPSARVACRAKNA